MRLLGEQEGTDERTFGYRIYGFVANMRNSIHDLKI
jgi:hypothetical protein